jgi:predicted dehydrogenase
MKPVRTGVVGVGYLGKYHAEKYLELDGSELVGVVDTSQAAAQAISNRLNVPAFKNYEELFDKVDAVSIVVPTELHHKIAKDFLLNGIDVLVEKPMTTTLEEAEDLIVTAKKNKCVLQVGHLERFNAAVLALNNVIKQPLFIESHRLAPFKDRGTDVDVILDIMIHDIDIILNIVGSPVKAIHAVGVPVVSSENNDIANVRLEFESGCVANVTASRISAKEMRKIRIFQHDAYLSIDYAAQQVEVYGKTDSDEHDTPQITYDQIDIKQGDSLKEEIRSFLSAVKSRSIPEVPGEAGKNALKVALEIVEQIETKKTTLKI